MHHVVDIFMRQGHGFFLVRVMSRVKIFVAQQPRFTTKNTRELCT